jgi:hypothetical protein
MTNIQIPHKPIRSAFTIIEKPLRYCYDQYNPTNDGSYPSVKNCLAYLGGMAVYPIVVCAAPVTMVADMTVGVAECIFCAVVRRDSLADIASLAKKKLVISPLHHLIFIITSLALPAFCLTSLLYNAQAPLSWLATAKLWLIPLPGFVLSILSTSLVQNAEHAKEVQEMPALIKPLTQNRLLFMAIQTFFIASASSNFLSLGIYTLPALTVLQVCALPLAITSLLWTFNYTLSQRMIGSLPSSWNHATFSIFIDRGAAVKSVGTRFDYAGDPEPGQTFQDLAFSDSNTIFWETFAEKCHAEYQKQRKRQKQVEWNAYLDKVDFTKIGTAAHDNLLYTQFRQGILDRKSPSELLGFVQKPTADELKKAFRKYSRAIHPDKNKDREAESTILFQCLQEATCQLEEKPEAEVVDPSQEPSNNSSAFTELVPVAE